MRESSPGSFLIRGKVAAHGASPMTMNGHRVFVALALIRDLAHTAQSVGPENWEPPYRRSRCEQVWTVGAAGAATSCRFGFSSIASGKRDWSASPNWRIPSKDGIAGPASDHIP